MNKSVFVSSTFKDFQTERDLLQSNVEIALTEALAGLSVSFVDLRWGIDTTQSGDLSKVVSICMSEVKNSHPYYVILLGDQYGSTVEKDVARSLYRLNDLPYDEREKSVTEIEIEATGLFSGSNEYVLVMHRQTDQTPDPRAKSLAEKVISHCKKENLYTYRASTRSDGSYEPLNSKEFCDFVVARFQAFLQGEAKNLQSAHLAIAKEHVARFAGRENTLKRLQAVLEGEDLPLFYRIGAPSGGGLSAVLAKLYDTFSQKENCRCAFVTETGDGVLSCAQFAVACAAEQLLMEETDLYNFLTLLDEQTEYYIFVDGCPDLPRDNHLQQLLMRDFVPENLHFILSVNDPDQADFLLDTPNKEDAVKMLSAQLSFYHKELPFGFTDYFKNNAPTALVETPVLLSYFVSSICYLKREEYRILGQSENFMDCLSSLFANRLSGFAGDEREYLSSFFDSETERDLLLLFAVSGFGINFKVARAVLKAADVEVTSGDFYTVKEKLRVGLLKNEIGYLISHESLKKAILSLYKQEEIAYLRYLYAEFLGQNFAKLTVPFVFREVLYQYLCLSDYEMICEMLDGLYITNESGSESGSWMCHLAKEFFANAPSEVYRNIVAVGNPYACLWLVKNAMPHLSKVYLKNASDMFFQMHRLCENLWDDPYALDLFGLYVESETLNLRGDNAMKLVSQAMRTGKMKSMPMEIFLSMYRMACFCYNTDFANDLIGEICDDNPKDSKLDDGHFLSYVDRMLECTVLLDGNAYHLRESLARLFDKAIDAMRRVPDEEHVPFVMAMIYYYCLLLRIKMPCDADTIVEFLDKPRLHEGSICHQLVDDFIRFYVSNAESGFYVVDMIEQYSQSEQELSFVDLYCLSRFFRRVCYMEDTAYTDTQKVKIAMGYYHKLRLLYDGAQNGTQSGTHFSELLALCYLLNVYACGTKDAPMAEEMLFDLKKIGKNLSFMKNEFSFFTEDIARCEIFSTAKGREGLYNIRAILEND